MIKRTTPRKKIDELAFPIRLRLEAPATGGWSNEIDDLRRWLRENMSMDHYAMHSNAGLGVSGLGLYLRDVELARDLLHRFADLKLADRAENRDYSPTYLANLWNGTDLVGVCNLYSLNAGQAAIIDMADAMTDTTGNLPVLSGIYPDMETPVVRNTVEGRELTMMRWGMPSPASALISKRTDSGLTNIRNTKSPHWRRWYGLEHRCVVPFTSFAEYQHQKGQAPVPAWFALSDDEPLAFFAGLWTEWTSVRKLKEGETTNNIFAFLTTNPNKEVETIHPKSMPVVLRTKDEVDQWMSAEIQEALTMQRPLPDGTLKIVMTGKREERRC